MDKKLQLSLMQDNKMYIRLNEIDGESIELWAVNGKRPNGEPIPGLYGVVHSDFLPKIRDADGMNDDWMNDELWLDLKEGEVIEIALNWSPTVDD